MVEIESIPDDNLNVAQTIELVFDRVENVVGKEQDADYQYFLLSHNVSKRLLNKSR